MTARQLINPVSRLLMGVLAVLALLAFAGCGSSDSSSDSASSSGSSSAGSGGSDASAKAAAAVQQLTVRPTSLSIPALPSKPPTGKTIDFVACGVPACQAYIPLVRAATDAIGWKTKVVNSGVTPQSINAAWTQVVRDRPAGVIGSGGVDPALFSAQLKQLKAADVPVVLQVVPDTTVEGVTAVVYGTKATGEDGQEMANVNLSDSKAKGANVAIFHTPATPVYEAADKAIKSTIESDACDSCSVDVQEFPITELGTTLPSKVVSYVRTHPKVNYLFFDFINEADGVTTALKRAGLDDKVKIVSIDITSTQRAAMKSGQILASAGNPWPEILWTEVNIVVRESMGLPLQPGVDVALPNMILNGSNLPDSGGSAYFPLVADYQSVFKQAWKVG